MKKWAMPRRSFIRGLGTNREDTAIVNAACAVRGVFSPAARMGMITRQNSVPSRRRSAPSTMGVSAAGRITTRWSEVPGRGSNDTPRVVCRANWALPNVRTRGSGASLVDVVSSMALRPPYAPRGASMQR